MTLAAWIDPTDDNVRTEASGRVTAITDKSPVGNDVTENASSGPAPSTIGALTVLDYLPGGPSDALETTLDYTFTGPDLTVIFAYTDDGGVAGSADETIVSAGDQDGNPGWSVFKDFAGSAVGLANINGDGRAMVTGGATGSFIDVLAVRYDATRDFSEVIKNAGALLTTAEALNNPTVTQRFTIGNRDRDFNHNSGWSSGEVGDVILFDGVMRYDQIQQVEGYLAHKYGSALLPTGHPFELQPPDAVLASEFMATFEGADAATSYTTIDTGARTATFAGNAQLDEQISLYGGSSLLLDGTGDYLTFPDSTDFDLGSGEFTIECWARWSADPTTGIEFIVAHWDANGVSQRAWLLGYDNDNLRFSYSTDGTAVTTVTHAMTLVVDTWFHLAVCRHRGNLLFFVDGILIGTTAIAVTLHSATATLDVGSLLQSGGRVTTEDFTGNIDSIRVTKGKALYTGSGAPPHRAIRSPMTAELIANFNDGTDAVTAYTSEDAGARTATFNGNAQLDTAVKKFGPSSLLLDGTGDYLTFPDSADFEMGAGDFFVDAWVRWSTDPTTTAEAIIGKWTTTGDQREWQLFLTNNLLTFQWSTAGTAASVASFNGAFNPAVSTWYHVAVKRFDDVMYLYVDGAVVASAVVTATFFAGTSPLMIGGDDSAAQDFTGNIDGVRITKAKTAIYHTDIEAPHDRPYDLPTDDSALLLNFDGADAATEYISDDEAARILSFHGTGALDDAQRRRGVTSLTCPSVTSGVAVPSSADLKLGTGDFTVECMVRFSALASVRIFFDQRTGAASTGFALYADGTTLKMWTTNSAKITGTTTLVVDTWYHVVCERVDGVTRLYLDGVQEGGLYATVDDHVQNATYWGGQSYTTLGSNGITGWIDAARMSVGKALYHGNFDVPVQGPGEPLKMGHF